MRISEFCNTFQISHQAVYAKIKKYAAELEGHISKDKGNVLDLDPFAVNLLKPKKASYKALDERNLYLENIYKETVSENERLRKERDKLVSKTADSDAVIEFMSKQVKEYADENANLKNQNAEYQSKLYEANRLNRQYETKCSEENEAHESEIARLTAEVEKLNERIKCSNEKNNEQWKKLQENRVEISNLNMDVAKRDDEIVKLNKKITDLKAKLQKYEDKQSAKQDASKQNSTKKSLFGRKK